MRNWKRDSTVLRMTLRLPAIRQSALTSSTGSRGVSWMTARRKKTG